MYLDCHVTVQAPQPFVSEAELYLIVLVLRHPLLLVTLILGQTQYPALVCLIILF